MYGSTLLTPTVTIVASPLRGTVVATITPVRYCSQDISSTIYMLCTEVWLSC